MRLKWGILLSSILAISAITSTTAIFIKTTSEPKILNKSAVLNFEENNPEKQADRYALIDDLPKPVFGELYNEINGLYCDSSNDYYTKPGKGNGVEFGRDFDKTTSISDANKNHWYEVTRKDVTLNLGNPLAKRDFLARTQKVSLSLQVAYNVWNSTNKWKFPGGKKPAWEQKTYDLDLIETGKKRDLLLMYAASNHKDNEKITLDVLQEWDGNTLSLSLIYGVWLHWKKGSLVSHSGLIKTKNSMWVFSSGEFGPKLEVKPSVNSFNTKGNGSWAVDLHRVFENVVKMRDSMKTPFAYVLAVNMNWATGFTYVVGNKQVTGAKIVNYSLVLGSLLIDDLNAIINGASIPNSTLVFNIKGNSLSFSYYSGISQEWVESNDTVTKMEELTWFNLTWTGVLSLIDIAYGVI